MRRLASEVIRNLEKRIARLENRSASKNLDIMDLAKLVLDELNKTNQGGMRDEIERGLSDFFSDFLSDPDSSSYADDSIYDLVFEVKEVKTDLRFVEMTVVVTYFEGKEKVKFQVQSKRRGGVKFKSLS